MRQLAAFLWGVCYCTLGQSHAKNQSTDLGNSKHRRSLSYSLRRVCIICTSIGQMWCWLSINITITSTMVGSNLEVGAQGRWTHVVLLSDRGSVCVISLSLSLSLSLHASAIIL